MKPRLVWLTALVATVLLTVIVYDSAVGKALPALPDALPGLAGYRAIGRARSAVLDWTSATSTIRPASRNDRATNERCTDQYRRSDSTQRNAHPAAQRNLDDRTSVHATAGQSRDRWTSEHGSVYHLLA
jgi:hypothetical protein